MSGCGDGNDAPRTTAVEGSAGIALAKCDVVGYGTALATVLVILLIRLALDPLLGERSPLAMFTISVVVSAWIGGLGPGILALVCGSVVGVFFFVAPRSSFGVVSADEAVNILLFWSSNAAVLFVTHRLAAARRSQESIAAELRIRERESRRSGDLLQTVIDGTPDPIYVKDRSGAFVMANRRTAGIFGTTPEMLVGRRDADFLPEHLALAVEAMDRDVMLTGLAILREEIVPEAGETRVYLSSKVPWRDETGEVRGLIGISRDITERKRAEAELAASEARLRAFFDASAAGLVQIDPRTRRFLRVNEAFCDLTGYRPDELLGLTTDDLTHPDDRMRDDELLAPMLAGEVCAYFSEKRYVRKDGGSIHVVVGASLIRDPEGRPSRTAAVAIDVTARRHAEAEVRRLNVELERRVTDRTRALAEANDELNAFAYTVSHDLRAPLRAMEGFARILVEDYADSFDEEGRRYADRIVGAAERMEGLIDDLLAYSRITRSRMKLRPVRLEPLVRDAVPEYLDPSRVELRLAGSPAVLAEPAMLRQVVTNLLSNAAKFQPRDGVPEIEVYARPVGRFVRMTVADNGIGIAPHHVDRIFGVFERLHGQEAYPGTGIGLAIVRKGIERMGGSSGVDSLPGRGSRFWIELPAAEEEIPEDVNVQI